VFDLYTLYHLILVSAHNGDEPLKDLQCHFAAQCSPTYIILCYVNNTTMRPTFWAYLSATCDWMLHTLQSHFAAQCSPNYIRLRYVNDTTTLPIRWFSLWRLTHKAKLSSLRTHLQQRLNPDSFGLIWLSHQSCDSDTINSAVR